MVPDLLNIELLVQIQLYGHSLFCIDTLNKERINALLRTVYVNDSMNPWIQLIH